MSAGSHIEIERKFLLDRVPKMPRADAIWRIEQGYLAPTSPDGDDGDGDHERDQMRFGRLRRITFDDGSAKHFHTIKTGVGASRIEDEREISAELFERHWPRTAERRLSKTRHRISAGNLVWEIDVFDGVPLVLAEVELPAVDVRVEFPGWLKPHVVREVTDDPAYTNASIAARIRK